jgi:hypothetical protein
MPPEVGSNKTLFHMGFREFQLDLLSRGFPGIFLEKIKRHLNLP